MNTLPRRMMLCALLSTMYCLPVSQETLRQKYSLLVKAVDPHKRAIVALVPGTHWGTHSISIPRTFFAYASGAWDEVAELWQAVRQPEDIGCVSLQLEELGIVSARACRYRAYAQADHVKNNHMETSYELCVELGLELTDALFVPHELLEECDLARYHSTATQHALSAQEKLDALEITFDEAELETLQRSEPPSALVVYARRVGVGLLMGYLTLWQYVGRAFGSIKRLFA